MIGLEILDKDIKWHRLTITPDRVTIKIRTNTSLNDKESIVKLFTEIAEKVQPNTIYSLRGNWDKHLNFLQLRNNQELIVVEIEIDNFVIKDIKWNEN